jgi:secreted Zn-dependent insulinase-like peptidase
MHKNAICHTSESLTADDKSPINKFPGGSIDTADAEGDSQDLLLRHFDLAYSAEAL